MGLETCDVTHADGRLGRWGFNALPLATVHVHVATLVFAQVIERLPVGTDHRIPVLTWTVCDIGVLTTLGIIIPYIACNRRGMVFAPLIFAAFAILIEKALAV